MKSEKQEHFVPDTSQVIVVAELVAKNGQADALRDVVRAAVQPSQQEPGNNVYRLHEDTQMPGHFILYENWKSQNLFEAHTRTPHFKTLVEKSKDLSEPISITLLRAISD